MGLQPVKWDVCGLGYACFVCVLQLERLTLLHLLIRAIGILMFVLFPDFANPPQCSLKEAASILLLVFNVLPVC